MIRDHEDIVLNDSGGLPLLRISRPTYLKYLYLGRIRGAKAGKGWKVLKSELDRFLKGESEHTRQHESGRGRTDEGRNRVKSLDDKVDIQEEKAIEEKVKSTKALIQTFLQTLKAFRLYEANHPILSKFQRS